MKIPIYALPHRVTIIPFKGDGAYGPIYETDPASFKKKVPCRIDPKKRMVKSTNGQDLMQQAEGIFHPDYKIRVGDKILWDLHDLEYKVSEWVPIDAMGPHSTEVVLT